MPLEADTEDRELCSLLVKHCSLSEIEGWVFVLVATKQIAKLITVPRLIEVLKLYHYYDALPSDVDIGMAIRGLIDKKVLSLSRSGNEEAVRCTDPLQTLDSIWCEDQPSLLDRAKSIISKKIEDLEKGVISILGPATSNQASTSFMDALNIAKVEIKLPVFSTRSHGPLRDALERAISRGVTVKLMMYSPKMALLTYGGDYDQEIIMMTGHWRREMRELNRRGPGHIFVRWITSLNHLHFSGGLIVDGRLYRYAVRYPGLQWGHEAVIVTGHNLGEQQSNFLMLLNYYFDIAWERAVPIDPWERVLHFVSFGKLPR